MRSEAYDQYLAELDADRIWRVKEISNFRSLIANQTADHFRECLGRAAVVMAYSHWEGYWSECVKAYIAYLSKRYPRPVLVNRNFIVGMISSHFDRLRNRNFSDLAKKEFVDGFFAAVKGDFLSLTTNEFSPRSNLNFERLKSCAAYLDFDISPFQPYRNRIDHELVRWRHEIAHGGLPPINHGNMDDHLDFSEQLTRLIQDLFIDNCRH